MKVGNSESKLIEESTQQQNGSCIVKGRSQPLYFIMPVLQAHSSQSRIPAVKWGIDYEDVVQQEYVALMNAAHANFKCSKISPHLDVCLDAQQSVLIVWVKV